MTRLHFNDLHGHLEDEREAVRSGETIQGDSNLDLDRQYTVVTTDFLFPDGDGYTTFTQGKQPYPYGLRLSSIVI